MRLFVGDDWAEDHHDVELMDAGGPRAGQGQAARGRGGIARLHAMIGEQLGEDARGTPGRSRSGSRPTGARGCRRWSRPGTRCSRSTRCRRPGTGNATACRGPRATPPTRTCWPTWCAPTPTSCAPVAGDSAQAEAVKVVTAHAQDADLGTHPAHPAAAARAAGVLPRRAGGLRGPGRRRHPGAAGQGPRPGVGGQADAPRRSARRSSAPAAATSPAKAERIQAVLRAEHLGQPAVVTAAYAASVRALVAVLATLNEQVKTLQGQVEAHFGQHPDAEIILSQPGLGPILGARVLAEFGDDPAPLRRRQGPQELRRHQPDHPRLRQEEGRRWPATCTTTGSSTPSWPRPSPP